MAQPAPAILSARRVLASASDATKTTKRSGRGITMSRRGMLILTTLPLLGITVTAVAAPNARERDKCYGSCEAKCAAEHSCERPDASRNCHQFQSVQGCLQE